MPDPGLHRLKREAARAKWTSILAIACGTSSMILAAGSILGWW